MNASAFLAILLVGVLVTAADRSAWGNVILEWNDAIIDTIRIDPKTANPGKSSRDLAMLNIAMYDAVMAVEKKYASFNWSGDGAGANAAVAAAQAGYEVMAGLYPEHQQAYHDRLGLMLGAIADGPGKSAGIELGKLAAGGMMTWRGDDGWDANVDYEPNPAPGYWRPDPVNPEQVAWGPGWGEVLPFGMAHVSQFNVPAPPGIDSEAYAAAYNEVKLLGAIDSTARTEEQTEIGIFWGYDRFGMGPPPIQFTQIAQSLSETHGLDLAETARLLTMTSVAGADAGVAAWHVKFRDEYWRPINGIREGDSDGNDLTEGDPDWTPLGAPGGGVVADFTPPFPAYVSGHATFAGAVFEMLANYFGTDEMSFEVISDELPGVVRHFESFSQAAEENGRSRIYLGIHWSFDDIEGRALGVQIADYIVAHHFQQIPEPAGVSLLLLAGWAIGRRR